MKRCRTCEQTKPLPEFSANQRVCLECNREYHADWRKNNKEKRLANLLWHRYGISLIDYEIMLHRQEGKCAICSKVMNPPCVDHCHTTKEVRGLLCRSCNKALGTFGDDLEGIQNVVKYLETFLAKHREGQNGTD